MLGELRPAERVRNRLYVALCEAAWRRAEATAAAGVAGPHGALAALGAMAEEDADAKEALLRAATTAQRAGAARDWEGWVRAKDGAAIAVPLELPAADALARGAVFRVRGAAPLSDGASLRRPRATSNSALVALASHARVCYGIAKSGDAAASRALVAAVRACVCVCVCVCVCECESVCV